MWAYKYVNQETRLHVPSFKTFLKQNHDILKLWCEEEQEPLDVRTNFSLRILRFTAYLFMLFLIVCALINPQDRYYAEECDKRMECYNDCNMAFFPEMECKMSSIQFRYGGNRYNKLYEFKRPDIRLGQTGFENFELCKSFIS